MPSVSQAQAGFMAMSRTAAGRAKLRSHGKTPAPVSVAKDYQEADRGRKIGKLAKHVAKRAEGGKVDPPFPLLPFVPREPMGAGLVPLQHPTTRGLPRRPPGEKLPEKARGGRVGPYMVGERGPEMFVPDRPGTIIPNHEIARLARKYGGRVGLGSLAKHVKKKE